MVTFAKDTTLNKGDVAIIIRNDGTVEVASAVDAEMLASPLHQRRALQHQLMITACYRMCVDPAFANHMIQLGSDPDTMNLFAGVPTEG